MDLHDLLLGVKDFFRYQNLRKLAAKSIVDSPLYSPKRDEERFHNMYLKTGTSEVTAELLVDLSEVAMRLHLFYLKKGSSKATDYSLSMANTLESALEMINSGELTCKEKCVSRIEALAEYWKEVTFTEQAIQSVLEEGSIVEKAEKHFRKGKPEEAIEELKSSLKERKIEDTKDQALTLREIAETYRQKGNLAKSVKYFEKAANLDPMTWFDVGYIYGEMKHFIKSRKAYEKLLKVAPNNSYAWNNIGWAYENLQYYSKALECYEKATELNKNLFTSWERKGWIYWKKRKIEQAIAAYEEATKIEPNNLNILFNLTALYNDELHDYEKAVYYAKKGVEVDPDSFSAKANLAESLVSAGFYDEARKNARRIIATDDDPSRSLGMHFTVAVSHFLEGDSQKGNEWLEKLIAFRTSLPSTFKNNWIFHGISNLIKESKLHEEQKSKLFDTIDMMGSSDHLFEE